MRKVAVICDPLVAEIFMLTDFEVRPVKENELVESVFYEIYQKGYNLIFITENLAEIIEAEIKAFQKRNDVIITVIPGIGLSMKLGENMLNEMIRKVTGRGSGYLEY